MEKTAEQLAAEAAAAGGAGPEKTAEQLAAEAAAAGGAGDGKKLTQEELEAEVEKWKAFSRKHEDESKAKSKRLVKLDAIEEANKTEAQRLTDRAEAAEKALVETNLRALRSEVAIAKGVPVALITGDTKDEMERVADAALAFRGSKPLPDMGGGSRGDDISGKNDFDVQIAEAQKSGNFQLVIALREAKSVALASKK